jgi:hypothetical protein
MHPSGWTEFLECHHQNDVDKRESPRNSYRLSSSETHKQSYRNDHEKNEKGTRSDFAKHGAAVPVFCDHEDREEGGNSAQGPSRDPLVPLSNSVQCRLRIWIVHLNAPLEV